ncbi:MAG: 16S rRNA (cytosine(1402)-N(4))-methyltransferase [Bacteroidetes bacterium GWF2_42_66]|nr:MAG: 16S rRNA (cytosine(1402)-N(4))-methyltransferase [Bacteroidetes bacterium GWA2_42_15]OFY00164.1 MAG: 16S rRNA (cytosine(1402)-N(4))-methyltransferase [Bacteroidetes bacterium GWE2_42_39]OFY40306.1 MAG: 16S rRNA (cytosine(1402)-N(4))-methyltransferase [Bacteroidetes bacterium GWF2_42_66]HBL73709.1 16S rRNA (cytosine(1402)-N(4))-methyltransferase [Prolixibacteraceae bacterium]HCR90719.1 16S rRNA (cytosine(1402)-N(4))-methyltransferase [Prolixibacteraceae bacterium]
MEQAYHIPVLLHESVQGLRINPAGDYVDVTFGGGGHSREIFKNLTSGRLFGFDQDQDAAANIISDGRFFFIRHNFKYIRNFLKYYEVEAVDGILADLGVSSHDFDVAERGFSFRFDAELDMRMNRDSEKTAADVVNDYPEEELLRIFKEYGEIQNAWKLTKEIVQSRSSKKIKTIRDFKEAISKCTPPAQESKYLAKVFQALRIETNDELEVLENFLEQSLSLLKPGGRLVVITYHSLEDRLVKNFMKAGNFSGEQKKDFYGNVNTPFELITRKVIVPSDEEIERNPRARSAKLRIAEKR